MSPQHASPASASDSRVVHGQRRPTDRLFFCLFPEPQACEAIAAEADLLRIENGLTGMPLKPSHLHVTLHHLGDHAGLPEDVVAKALAAGQEVKLQSFDLSLTSACSLSGRGSSQPCVLLSAEERPPVHALWRELGTRLLAQGLGRYLEPDFTPHVTILHDRQELAPESVAPIRWTVRDFALVHSLLGKGEYRTLGAWTLDR